MASRLSPQPMSETKRSLRTRLGLFQEFALALLPTLIVLLVFFFVQVYSRQQLLFASLASSVFLIYLDPQHETNSTRTLVLSQILAAFIGVGAHWLLGPGYLAAGSAMVIVILLMILLNAVHPPAVSTALGFGFRTGPESNLLLFALAVGLLVVLVGLQRLSLWLLTRYTAKQKTVPTLPAQ